MIFTMYVWLLGVATLTPLWGLLVILPVGSSAERAINDWARLILRLAGCRVTIRGLDRLQSRVPAVIVVNHASYLDAVALMASLPRPFRFVVNHRAAAWPLVGLAIRKAKHLVVDRGRLADRHACALAMIETLATGTSVVVFPEGTFNRDGRLLPFKTGPFRIAAEAGCPVVPVALSGTRTVLEGGLGRFRRGAIDVTVGEPLPPTSTDRADVARLRDTARRAIAHRLNQTRAV
jgi:1-acyl-sn-glycerol-3-phosphate acyltransferase